MKIKKLVITILLVCKIFNLSAQEIKITGTIKDSLTGAPLLNAIVTVKSADTLLFNTTVLTRENGLYALALPAQGFYRLEVTYIGYIIKIQDSVLFDATHFTTAIALLPSLNYLQKVVVNSKKPFIVMGNNKITLNVAQSPVAAGSNAYEVIKKAPGVIEQDEELSFRGKPTRILINGRPTNLSGQDLKTMLTDMPAGNIEKIEILPNPSAKYDAQGGSVINIVLAKNKSYGTNYVLTDGIGTGKYVRGNTGLDVNYRNNTINLYGGYTYNNNAQYFQTSTDRYLTASQLVSSEYDLRKRNNNTYKLGLDDDINDKTSIGFLINGYVNYRNRKVDNSSVLHYYNNSVDSSSAVRTIGKAIFNSSSMNAYYKKTLDTTGKELTLNADYMRYNEQWKDDFTDRYYDAKGQEYLAPDYLKDNSPTKIKVYALTADYTQPTKKGSLEAGVKIAYILTDNNIAWQTNNGTGWLTDKGKTNHFIYTENVNAGYVNYISSIKKWNAEAGLRVEQTNTIGNSVTVNEKDRKNYLSWFPSISVGYTINKDNVVGLSYRKSIERFGFDYVNPFILYQNQYAYKQGNPKLEPQIDQQFSFNYTLHQSIIIGVDYTHSTKALGVSYISIGDTTISSYANFKGNDILYGYINYTKTLFSIWQLNANLPAGYFSYDIDRTNNEPPQKKKPSVSLQAGNIFNFNNDWDLESYFYYSGNFFTGVYSMQAFYTTDIGVTKSIWKKKVNLKISVADIFNSEKSNLNINYRE